MRPTAVLTAAALALAAAPALAQPAPGAPPPEGGPGGGQWAQMREQRQAEMATDVHTILHIRPDQEAAFQTFLAAIRPPGGPGAQPGQMEAAYQAFSAVLTPDQQQVLAALRRLALERPRWGGRMHHRAGDEGEGQ